MTLWKVRGVKKTRGHLELFNDEITTSRPDSSVALRKARGQHKRVCELSVTEVVL